MVGAKIQFEATLSSSWYAKVEICCLYQILCMTFLCATSHVLYIPGSLAE